MWYYFSRRNQQYQRSTEKLKTLKTELIFEKYCLAENSNIKENVFSASELNTLNNVVEKFKSMNVSEIILHRHEEKGWKENIEGYGVISYEWGWEMLYN